MNYSSLFLLLLLVPSVFSGTASALEPGYAHSLLCRYSSDTTRSAIRAWEIYKSLWLPRPPSDSRAVRKAHTDLKRVLAALKGEEVEETYLPFYADPPGSLVIAKLFIDTCRGSSLRMYRKLSSELSEVLLQRLRHERKRMETADTPEEILSWKAPNAEFFTDAQEAILAGAAFYQLDAQSVQFVQESMKTFQREVIDLELLYIRKAEQALQDGRADVPPDYWATIDRHLPYPYSRLNWPTTELQAWTQMIVESVKSEYPQQSSDAALILRYSRLDRYLAETAEFIRALQLFHGISTDFLRNQGQNRQWIGRRTALR